MLSFVLLGRCFLPTSLPQMRQYHCLPSHTSNKAKGQHHVTDGEVLGDLYGIDFHEIGDQWPCIHMLGNTHASYLACLHKPVSWPFDSVRGSVTTSFNTYNCSIEANLPRSLPIKPTKIKDFNQFVKLQDGDSRHEGERQPCCQERI